MAAPKKAAILNPAALERTAGEILAQILERLDGDQGRIMPYCRVKELCPPFTKPYVYGLLRDGHLLAVKWEGLILIEIASVEEWLAKCEPWRPPK